MPRVMHPVDGVLGAIGGTPLVALSKLDSAFAWRLYAKLESQNPGGSAKDRPAKRMIEQALQQGLLKPGGVVVESSSGNLGVGLAQVCRYYDLPFICVVDPRAQPCNVAIMKAYGAEVQVVRADREEDYLAARIKRVRQLVEQMDHAYWPNQYANRDNPAAHAETTAREIHSALDGDLDWLFVAASSTGTLAGCQRYFAQALPSVKVVAVDSVGSVLFSGISGERKLPGMGAGRVPPLAHGVQPDGVVRVTDADCVRGCRRLVRREALLAGASGGGVIEAVLRSAPRLTGNVVAILHDSGARYMDTVYNDDWVTQHLGADALTLPAPAQLEAPVVGTPVCLT